MRDQLKDWLRKASVDAGTPALQAEIERGCELAARLFMRHERERIERLLAIILFAERFYGDDEAAHVLCTSALMFTALLWRHAPEVAAMVQEQMTMLEATEERQASDDAN